MASVSLVLNAGSSSLKFQAFEQQGGPEPGLVLRGMVDKIGGNARLRARDARGEELAELSLGEAVRHEDALMFLVSWLRSALPGREPGAIGHRVVHGGDLYKGPVLVDDAVLEALERLAPLAPLHQPHNLEPIRIVRRRMPNIAQVASFDTAFHATQPPIARMFALPSSVRDKGVKRYGFHGLSYAHIASVLGDFDPALPRGRVVVAHLGNGASLCALKAGRSVATTMGFSALDGLPMGTRCGSLDPAIVFFMLREMKLAPEEAERLLYTKSGLLGISGTTSDMRTLRANAHADDDARAAIDLFVYRAQREIGSLVAALGGIDALVFTGGIGENDVATRAEVLAGLGWLGFDIDAAANESGGPRISSGSPSAWVIPTNEELVIARQMWTVLGGESEGRGTDESRSARRKA
jgi:acetate kinase